MEKPANIQESALRQRPNEDAGQATGSVDRYLALLKKIILNEIYLQDEERLYYLRRCLEKADVFDYRVLHDIAAARPETHREFLRSREIGQFPYRKIGNSGFQHSMIGRIRLDSLHRCLEAVCIENIAGDLIECGVWRGGAAIFMQGFLKAHGIAGRRVILADSFEGLPSSGEPDDPSLTPDSFPELAVKLETVIENFRAYDLWDENVVALKGWFSDTLPNCDAERIALLRADGDLYTSTTDILENLYEKVSPGGFIIIDDYGVLPSCARAVREFFERRGEAMPAVEQIDWSGVYWRKRAPQ